MFRVKVVMGASPTGEMVPSRLYLGTKMGACIKLIS